MYCSFIHLSNYLYAGRHEQFLGDSAMVNKSWVQLCKEHNLRRQCVISKSMKDCYKVTDVRALEFS